MESLSLEAWRSMPDRNPEEMIVNASTRNEQDDWTPFPIGMACWFVPVYRAGTYKHRGPHDRLVLCAIQSSSDAGRRSDQETSRSRFLQSLAENGIHNQDLSREAYFDALPHYQFVISPEGNGIDCHRHYEALMAGCIPIVEDHEGIREKYRGCPILFTRDYREITEAYLLQAYDTMKDGLYDFSRLLKNSYPDSLQQAIHENGDFWVHRLLGTTWYSSMKK